MENLISKYTPTHFEQMISDKFLENGILTLRDMDIDIIAAAFNIEIYYDTFTNSFVDERNGTAIIVLSNNDSVIETKEKFHHELIHILFHKGDQRSMCESMKAQQERDVNTWLPYSMMPLHMLRHFAINDDDILEEACYWFNVDKKFAWDRINKIYQQVHYQISGVI
ncbi:ImmA/IrrE family metallo-endopeptidase [Bacillus cereus]|uniref:ImmA/IrrE family metallo-endopeptidase n=1 Tax=Bacillus cereus TaxID=1396 RepID=UPI0018F42EF6|nr:ImmA/IrrE family metallo-endopeptidase [Bacillus cereus]MBJ8024810.1 ImmA/IrrE family metallo-endopeptidase [Bacillus cereus]